MPFVNIKITRDGVTPEKEAFGFHEVWFQLEKFVRRYPEDRKGIRAGNGP